jgi:Family of unknown function (DUF6152)
MTAKSSTHAIGALLMLMLGAGAHAHHSAAMFDDSHRMTLTGTVREFQWSNPHCYVQLLVKPGNGKAQEWSLEMGAPTYLYNLGWRPSTLKTGEQVTVKIAPLRKGGSGGLLLELTKADGRHFGGKP